MERNDYMNIATYQTAPEVNRNGTFFFTDCGHKMFSINNNNSVLPVYIKEYRQFYILEVLKKQINIGIRN